MSLLMEALKKAEEAKRAASEGRTTDGQAPRELELAPLEPAKPEFPSEPTRRQPAPAAISPLPELALHINSVDADLAAVSKESEGKRNAARSGAAPSSSTTAKKMNATPAADPEQAAARNVFSAKQTDEQRSSLWFILPIASVIATSIGAYFWLQLQAVSTRSLAVPAPVAASAIARNDPTPGQATPLAAPLAEQPVQVPAAVNAPTVAEAATPLPEPVPTTAPAPAPVKQNATASSSGTSNKNRASSANGDREPEQTPRQKPTASPAESVDPLLRLTRSQPTVNLPLEQAYSALQAGRFDVAQRAYQQVLRGDPKNTDALLGLATVAARQGDAGRAHSFYLLALESDPNDPTAQAGVIQTRGQSDPAQSESRLKTALANQPDSPALLFALGNLFAREQRWGEAQQAYFRAYSTEPDNADFIFNLAVSLDQLHQDKLAAQYYQMALNAASGSSHPVGFDRVQVQNRIRELLP